MKKILAMTLVSLGCGSGAGDVSFTTWGEELIEESIPADMFADGWTVKYSKFLIVISDVTVADAAGKTGGAMMGSRLYDMHQPGKKPVVTFKALEAKPWERVSYSIRPADAATELAGATEADKQLMTMNGYSVYVDAVVTKAMVKKHIVWGFKTNTRYEHCKGELDGKEIDGAVVTNGGTDAIELTIHGDHFFYDDLGSQDAKRRFDNIAAADADMNGEVTLAELSTVKLVSLDPKNGGYGTGAASGISELGAFVNALSRTLGHFRGEGECTSKAR